MCHLILFLPVLAIPLFWFTPLSVATPVYIVILMLSAWIYYLALRAMRLPIKTGTEGLVHSTGKVVGKEDKLFHVRVQSEIWKAESTDELRTGDLVEIIAAEGLKLKVRRLTDP